MVSEIWVDIISRDGSLPDGPIINEIFHKYIMEYVW